MSFRGEICSSTFLEVEDGSRFVAKKNHSLGLRCDHAERMDREPPHRLDLGDRGDQVPSLSRSEDLENGDDQFTESLGLPRTGHEVGALPTPYLLSCEGPVFDRKFLHHARHLLCPGPPLFHDAPERGRFQVRRARRNRLFSMVK